MDIYIDENLKFNDFGKMLVQGLKIIAIILVYSIIPIAILIMVIFNSDFLFSNIGNNIYLNIPPELFFASLILGLISFIFINLAIPHMIENKTLKSGFKIKELIKTLKTVGIGEYVLYSIGSIIILISMLIMLFLIVEVFTSTVSFISMSIFSIVPSWNLMGVYYDLILYGLLMVLIIYPTYLIFQTRAMALIYETNDSYESSEDEKLE